MAALPDAAAWLEQREAAARGGGRGGEEPPFKKSCLAKGRATGRRERNFLFSLFFVDVHSSSSRKYSFKY